MRFTQIYIAKGILGATAPNLKALLLSLEQAYGMTKGLWLLFQFVMKLII